MNITNKKYHMSKQGIITYPPPFGRVVGGNAVIHKPSGCVIRDQSLGPSTTAPQDFHPFEVKKNDKQAK